MTKNNVLAHVSNDICCGCGACVNICPTKAIKYNESRFGFIFPRINDSECVSCGKCTKVCPVENINVHKAVVAYAAMNRNSEILKNSSSGGIFSQLAIGVLEQGGYIYGSTMDDELQVRHICIDSWNDLKQITKSKYVQSFLGNTFCDVQSKLEAGSKVLFCGTPCQVAALNNFVEERLKENLLTVDIVCHGVPSQKFFDSYIGLLQKKKHRKISEYIFRYKRSSFDGMNWYSSYKFENENRIIINWPEDSYNYYYMKGVTYRESCYQCKYAQQNRPGDISLCDYWGFEKKHKEFTNCDSVSGIIVNTLKGEKILGVASPYLKIYETDIQHLIDNNGCLKAPTRYDSLDEDILEQWVKAGYEYIDRRFNVLYRKQRIKYKIMRHIPKKVIYLFHRK